MVIIRFCRKNLSGPGHTADSQGACKTSCKVDQCKDGVNLVYKTCKGLLQNHSSFASKHSFANIVDAQRMPITI